MPGHVDFLIRSSERVLAHCSALLDKPLDARERARLQARVAEERELLTRLRAAHERLAA